MLCGKTNDKIINVIDLAMITHLQNKNPKGFLLHSQFPLQRLPILNKNIRKKVLFNFY
jgi:hypothetical protein